MFALMVVQYTAAPSPINIKYQFGRKDSHSCNAGNGRLPGAQNGLKNIYQVFVNQLGLTMSDAGIQKYIFKDAYSYKLGYFYETIYFHYTLLYRFSHIAGRSYIGSCSHRCVRIWFSSQK